jgi:hypothetical protein
MINFVVLHMTRYAETYDDRILNQSRHALLVSHQFTGEKKELSAAEKLIFFLKKT